MPSTLAASSEIVPSVTGSLSLQDISHDGRLLMVDEHAPARPRRAPPGARKSATSPGSTGRGPRAFRGWTHRSLYESGAGGGPGYSAYVRGTDGSPAVRLGEGQSVALSPDGKWAVALDKLTNPHSPLSDRSGTTEAACSGVSCPAAPASFRTAAACSS